MKIALCATLICLGFALASAKTFQKCELATTLVGLGIAREQVHHWVCMADAESSRRTDAVGRNKNGSSDYGLFQINSYWNCDPQDGRPTKNGCATFLNDSLSDDVQCVKQVLREHKGSFSSFSYGYKDRCSNVGSSYLSGCTY